MPAQVEMLFDLTGRFAAGMEREAEALVHATAQQIAELAIQKILEGPKTGAVYTSGPPPVPHQASAPGESPANWQGELAGSIHAVPLGPREALVEVGSDHALPLEFGRADGTIAPRPFVQPAVDEATPAFEAALIGLAERAAQG
jgi:hypothetical protein